MIYGNYSSWKKNCHTGNTLVYQEPNGGALYIGGWTTGAIFDWNTHVIDLTGSEHKFQDIPFAYDKGSEAFLPFVGASYAGWLSLPFPDFGVPTKMLKREQWEGMALTIQNILKQKKDVLVACHGGHGRSGLFCAIVGYLLNIGTDRSWSSPVEKIRDIHCDDAVETFTQEKFVYDILGLNIKIKHTYVSAARPVSYEACPICNTQSMFVEEIGMCKGCQAKYEKLAPKRTDLTVKDIQHKGEVEHSCTREKCAGIWKAEKCGHVVHDQIIYEGWCQTCWDKYQEEIEYAEKQLDKETTFTDKETPKTWEPCCMCETQSMHSNRFGICYDCAESLKQNGTVDFVHNSITDPYVAVPHHCTTISCIGVVMADICGHVVHNMEIEDGLCPECRVENLKRNHKEVQ